jgi:hypothetical protein
MKLILKTNFVQFKDFFALTKTKLISLTFLHILEGQSLSPHPPLKTRGPLPFPCHPTQNPFGEYPLTPCQKEKNKQKNHLVHLTQEITS